MSITISVIFTSGWLGVQYTPMVEYCVKWVDAMRWLKSTQGFITLVCQLASFIYSANHMLSVGIVHYTHNIIEEHN